MKPNRQTATASMVEKKHSGWWELPQDKGVSEETQSEHSLRRGEMSEHRRVLGWIREWDSDSDDNVVRRHLH